MNVDKGGFPQTLYNIFSFLQPENFLFITSAQSHKIAPASAPFNTRTLTYNLEIIPVQKNRLAKYVNGFINWFNYSFSAILKSFNTLKSSIQNFNPDVAVVAPNGAEAVFIYHKLKPVLKGKKVFPYFMDDWLYQSQLKWFGGNIHQSSKALLHKNNCWLMISKNLADIFSERYHLKPARVLEIHNPVDITGLTLPLPVEKKETYTLAYAGALWPMHFDAFLVMAEAIKRLQHKRKINLVLYTSESNWNWRKEALKNLPVHYGGFIPYKKIHQRLSEADCLLITSSFTKEWQTHSKGSVQTKITDYLKAGRLIISCGPAYAANNHFLKRYDCGVCIETNNVDDAAKQLDCILKNIEVHSNCLINGFNVLKDNFSFEIVHQRLQNFLSA